MEQNRSIVVTTHQSPSVENKSEIIVAFKISVATLISTATMFLVLSLAQDARSTRIEKWKLAWGKVTIQYTRRRMRFIRSRKVLRTSERRNKGLWAIMKGGRIQLNQSNPKWTARLRRSRRPSSWRILARMLLESINIRIWFSLGRSRIFTRIGRVRWSKGWGLEKTWK